MSDRIGSMTVHKDTRPEDVEAFLQREGALTKVRAQKNSDGSFTLFTTDRATGWWGQLTGLSKERETAREALEIWFGFKFGPELSRNAKDLLRNCIGSGEVDVLSVRRLAGEAKNLAREPEPPSSKPYEPILPSDGMVKRGEKLILGGTEYVYGKQLGVGGYGQVFEGVSEAGEKVAIKEVKNVKTRLAEVEREFRAHERAMGQGHDTSHIVGLKGAAIGPNGHIQAIVVEHMPGGDAKHMLSNLREAERRGRITPDQARLIRLTVAKDMATGLAQLHEGRGMMHYDIKPENFLISGDGVVKLADFGSARPEEEMRGEVLGKGYTPVYMSPDIERADRRVGELRLEIARLNTRAEERGFTKEALVDLTRSQKLRREIDTTSVDSKGDVFSLGLSFVKAFEDKQLGTPPRNYLGAILADIKALGSGGSERNRVLGELGVRGNSPEHKLIREMLAGDPEDRPTAREVAESQLFDAPGIGSQETRELMLKVARRELT